MDEQTKTKVLETLDKLRPYLQMDGGDLEFVEITDDNIVRIKLQGACAGCPGSVYTLKYGIEQYLKKEVPEVAGVEAVPQ